MVNSARPEIASFGPILRSRDFSKIDVVQLLLTLKNPCGLVLNQNLPLPDGHCLSATISGRCHQYCKYIVNACPEIAFFGPIKFFLFRFFTGMILSGKNVVREKIDFVLRILKNPT